MNGVDKCRIFGVCRLNSHNMQTFSRVYHWLVNAQILYVGPYVVVPFVFDDWFSGGHHPSPNNTFQSKALGYITYHHIYVSV